ncbi:MAG: class I SAM-dependent rRNA methyltransferase [Pseudomonadota bacterium]
MATLFLKPRQDRRIKRGHLWVYSNEVDVSRSPLDDFAAGDTVDVVTHAGDRLGRATVNPHTLVCARLFSRDAGATLDPAFFEKRLRAAMAVRAAAFPTPHYRLVHADGDLLPGLVIDRYDDVLVAQLGSAGMDRARDELLTALQSVLQPSTVVWRNDARARRLEGLDQSVDIASGPHPGRVSVIEGGLQFGIDPMAGQKTGWFYDQRANRLAFRRWAPGRRVLDLFSYVGAWAVGAAAAGAASVTAVDSSEHALEALARNAGANGVDVETRLGDALAILKQLRESGERYDVVVLDPPALITRRKDARAGLKHYHTLNQHAVRLLEPGGILVSCSCSHHLAEHDLLSAVETAMHRRGGVSQWLARGDQDVDHPVHPAMPESRYLKTVTCRLLMP